MKQNFTPPQKKRIKKKYNKNKKTATNNRNLTQLQRNAYDLKATDCRFAKHRISVCVYVCVTLGVNKHTCTDSFTGQSSLLKMVCSNRVSLFISVNSASTRGLVKDQKLVKSRLPLYWVAFLYPLNQHQGSWMCVDNVCLHSKSQSKRVVIWACQWCVISSMYLEIKNIFYPDI